MDKEMSKKAIMSMLDTPLDEKLNFNPKFENISMNAADYKNLHKSIDAGTTYMFNDPTAWGYWERDYYPYIIKESYPIYIQERAIDKGKQAFEIIKHLQDKKLMKLETVRDFIEAMDCLLRIL